uniref:Uncharacterized protein n=1 Tax=Anopheles coluzzii TaxID=1518534 RepID=A0A8W7PPT8_ANOCL
MIWHPVHTYPIRAVWVRSNHLLDQMHTDGPCDTRRTQGPLQCVLDRVVGQHLPHPDRVQEALDGGTVFRQPAEDGTTHLLDVDGRREGVHAGHFRVVFGPGGGEHEEHGRTLRVADVVEAPCPRHGQDVIDRGGQIVVAHLVPVPIAAQIGQPHVVPLVGQQVGETVVRPDDEEIGRAGKQPVHQQHRDPSSGQLLGHWSLRCGYAFFSPKLIAIAVAVHRRRQSVLCTGQYVLVHHRARIDGNREVEMVEVCILHQMHGRRCRQQLGKVHRIPRIDQPIVLRVKDRHRRRNCAEIVRRRIPVAVAEGIVAPTVIVLAELTRALQLGVVEQLLDGGAGRIVPNEDLHCHLEVVDVRVRVREAHEGNDYRSLLPLPLLTMSAIFGFGPTVWLTTCMHRFSGSVMGQSRRAKPYCEVRCGRNWCTPSALNSSCSASMFWSNHWTGGLRTRFKQTAVPVGQQVGEAVVRPDEHVVGGAGEQSVHEQQRPRVALRSRRYSSEGNDVPVCTGRFVAFDRIAILDAASATLGATPSNTISDDDSSRVSGMTAIMDRRVTTERSKSDAIILLTNPVHSRVRDPIAPASPCSGASHTPGCARGTPIVLVELLQQNGVEQAGRVLGQYEIAVREVPVGDLMDGGQVRHLVGQLQRVAIVDDMIVQPYTTTGTVARVRLYSGAGGDAWKPPRPVLRSGLYFANRAVRMICEKWCSWRSDAPAGKWPRKMRSIRYRSNKKERAKKCVENLGNHEASTQRLSGNTYIVHLGRVPARHVVQQLPAHGHIPIGAHDLHQRRNEPAVRQDLAPAGRVQRGHQRIGQRHERAHDPALQPVHVHRGRDGLHVDQLRAVLGPLGQQHEQHHRALGKATVVQPGGAGRVQHVVDQGAHIVQPDLVPGKVPKLTRACVRIVVQMFARVARAARVAHPHVEPGIGQQVGEGPARPHQHPVGTAAQ